MYRKHMLMGVISLAGLVCTPVLSQTASSDANAADNASAPKAPAACSDAKYRQLDFWVGEWNLEWDKPDGSKGTGTNIITKSPYGDCVITENFDGAPSIKFKGMSVSTYHKPAELWRQTWVDDQGGYFALTGGPNADGTFTLTNTRLDDKAPHSRMVWSEITKDSLVWSWQGHKAVYTDKETKWKDQWVIRYTRK